MSRTAYGALLCGVILMGLLVGWLFTHPIVTPLQPTVRASFGRPAPAPAPTGADTADGWKDRQPLREHLSAALDQMEQTPCDAAARASFFDAFASRASVIATDSTESPDENGPPFWHTTDDVALDQRVSNLVTNRYVTGNELAKVVMRRKLSAEFLAAHAAGPMPIDTDRCGENTLTAHP